MPDTSSSGSQGINIGDAVISFLGDTTQLDKGVDSLNARIEGGMAANTQSVRRFDEALDATGVAATEAGEVVVESMDRSRASIGEARAEVGLLGEEFGVRLPRHVRGFVAELPGVGEALSAAFAATAVLFIIEAVVKLTEKVTDFVGTTFIYTETMKAADLATASLNTQIKNQEARLDEATKAFDRVGLSADKLAHLKIADNLKEQLDQIDKALKDSNASLEKQEAWWKRAGFAVSDWLGITTHAEEEATRKHQEMLNNQTQADKAAAEARKTAAEEAATVEKKELLDFEAAQKKVLDEAAKVQFKFYEDKLHAAGKEAEAEKKLQDSLLENLVSTTAKMRLAMPDLGSGLSGFTKSLLQAKDAAERLGIVTKNDLILNLVNAQHAMDLFTQSGVKDDVAMKQFQKQVQDASNAVKFYGKELKDSNLELQLAQELAGSFGSKLTSGFIEAATGAKGWGQAMQEATGQAISALGQYCQVQAMTHLAKAIGEWWNGAAAGADFAAAAEFEAAALACGVAGGTMSGAGGSGGGGGSYSGTGTTGNTTSGSAVHSGPTTSVQRFASGGLISSPTLAVLGDSPSGGPQSEAVLPLENPEVMAKIAGAIAAHIGGGGGAAHTFNGTFFGALKHSDLKKLTKQINQAVNKGTATLKSTQTGRVVKRSQ
jgi:hypothetical protein